MSNLQTIENAKKTLRAHKKVFEMLLPETYQSFMLTLFLAIEKDKTGKIAQCPNLLEVAKKIASWGLIVGEEAGQAYLIPYYDTKEKKYYLNLQIGYKGYVAKLNEQGFFIEADTVTNEEINKGCFQEIRGTNPQIIHTPIRNSMRTRENINLGYCVISKHGVPPTISTMSKEEIEEVAKTDFYDKSLGKKVRRLSPVWQSKERKTDYNEMCKKTVIKNCAKRVNCAVVSEIANYKYNSDNISSAIKDITPVNENPKAETLDDVIALFDNNQKDVENTENMCDNADDYEKTVSNKKV